MSMLSVRHQADAFASTLPMSRDVLCRAGCTSRVEHRPFRIGGDDRAGVRRPVREKVLAQVIHILLVRIDLRR